MIDFQMFQSIASNVAAIRSTLLSARAASHDPEVARKLSEAITLVTHINDLAILAQADALSSQSECTRLTQRIAQLENWDSTAQRYALLQINPGQFVYHAKALSNEPSHYACADCFNERVKSVLQVGAIYPGAHRLICNRCALHLWISADGADPHQEATAHCPQPATASADSPPM